MSKGPDVHLLDETARKLEPSLAAQGFDHERKVEGIILVR